MNAYEILCGTEQVGVFFPEYRLAVLYPLHNPGFLALGSLEYLEFKYRDLVNDRRFPWKLGEACEFKKEWLIECLEEGEPKADNLARWIASA